MKKESTFLVVTAFFAIYLIWGTTYVAIIFGLKGFPPFILSAIRFFTAGVLLFCWAILKGKPVSKLRIWVTGSISGWLMLIGGSGLIAWSETYVGPGYAAIIVATTPFLFIIMDKKRWTEYFSNKLTITGLIMGFTGLVFFFNAGPGHPQAGANHYMIIMATIVLFFSCILWVTGSLYSRNMRQHGDSNFMTSAIQLMAAGAGSAIIAGLTGEWNHFSLTVVPTPAWAALAYLITLGSVVSFVAFTWLITIRPPAIVSTHTYINPIVAVVLGWIVTNEQFSAGQMTALFIILSGMLLTNLPRYKNAFKKPIMQEIP